MSNLISRRQDLEKLVRRLENRNVISLDFETTDLDWNDSSVVVAGIALADGEDDWYVAVRIPDKDGELQVTDIGDKWPPFLFRILRGVDRVFMHNAKFDMHWLANHGLYPRQPMWIERGYAPEVWDTMGLAHMANEGTPINLKDLAWIYLDREPMEWDESNFVDLDRMVVYACADARNTYDLAIYLGRLLEKENLLGLYHEYGHRMPEIALEMERRGYGLDFENIERDGEYLEDYVDYLTRRLSALGPGLENPNSYQQRSDSLDALGFDGPKDWRTDSGSHWSTKESNVIQMLQEYKTGPIHEFLFAFGKYQEANKMLSFISNTSGGGLLELQQEGIIHPNWLTFATVTWRWACSRPNLQQMPRPAIVGEGTDWERKINPRNWFKSPYEGWLFGAADLSQAELRYMAAMAGEQKMVEAYNEGKDLHQMVADDITMEMGVEVDRYAAKQVNYAEAYGASAWRLATDPKLLPHLSVAQTQGILDAKARIYPNLSEWKRRTGEDVRLFGEVRTAYGVPRRPALARLRSLHGIHHPENVPAGPNRAMVVAFHQELAKKGYKPDDSLGKVKWMEGRGIRQAVNARIQGSVAQHLAIAMKAIRSAGVEMLGQVHDEVHYHAPPELIEWADSVVEDALNIEYGGVIISGDAAHATHWGGAK